MSYRNKTYVAFASEDIGKYRLMEAWKANPNFDFNFYDAHTLYVSRDTSQPETIKRNLRERMKNAKQVVLLGSGDARRKGGDGVSFLAHEIKVMMEFNLPVVIANLGGHSEEDYLEGARLLNEAEIDLLELNISCPNVKAGGMAFGLLAATAADITKKVKAVTRHPLMVKLSPNAPDIAAVARACEDAGADAISLVNTFLGMAVDVKRKKAVFNNVYAGLSGPAIQPLALRMVHQATHAVKIPVVGLGGIATAQDALKFLMAGARAVQVGTMTFADPRAMLSIIDGLSDYCESEGLSNLQEIVGII